jgi:PEP-CTERM motif
MVIRVVNSARPRQSALRSLLVMGLVVLGAVSASAASLTIRTGVDASGAILESDKPDPFWEISVQGGAFTSAEVAGLTHPIVCCGMETVGLQARWISDPTINPVTPGTGWGIGPIAVARRVFSLSAFDVSTVAMSGAWRVADSRWGVYINGNLLPGTATNAFGFASDQPLTVAAGSGLFNAGLNVIELRGNSVNSSWDGFWLDVTLDGRDSNGGGGNVPEPTSLVLLGTAFLGVVARRARRA